ncbi:MAG: DUF4230 domain-containing protein [Bernardetiaceae bacterium]
MKHLWQTLPLWLLIIILAAWGLGQYFKVWEQAELPPTQTQTVHDMVLEEIQLLGKLELVKYRIKEIVEHRQTNRLLPDAKVLLVVVGEVVGCVDLAQIRSEGIIYQGDSLIVRLPAPEICYTKINHQDSYVYNTEYTIVSGKANIMVAEALKNAETQIEESVRAAGILEQTQEQGERFLRPLLERLTNKTVILLFS